MIHWFKQIVTIVTLSSLLLQPTVALADQNVRLPSDTKVLLELTERLVARKRDYKVGDQIGVRVWRDVVVDGQTVVKAGTPATLRVESIKAPGIVGRKGKVVLGGVSTTSVDGSVIHLEGGYNKAGKGRVALTATVGAILFWPALFIPGGPPKFPAGTIIDTYVSGSYDVAVHSQESTRPVIYLGSTQSVFTADIDYDALLADKKPKHFPIEFEFDESYTTQALTVDTVNGKPIDPIAVELAQHEADTGLGLVSIKTLSKHFQKGINRFEVCYQRGEDRIASEVIMEIQL